MITWLRTLWFWLAEKRILWLTIAVTAIAMFVAFGLSPDEARVRRVGWVLELLGLCTIVWEIFTTLREFGQPGFLADFRNWLNRVPLPWARIGTMEAHLRLPAITASGRMYGWHEVPPDASIDARVAATERNLKALRDELTQTQREIDSEKALRERSLTAERQARETAITAISQKLIDSQTQGLNVSAMGVVWLVFGLTLSTIPTELLDLFK